MGAPKGNQYGVGNNGGVPPFYSDPKELERKIDEYFKSGHKQRDVVVTVSGKQQTIKVDVITITGIAYYLGFESRQSFYDYEMKKEFAYIIKRARLFVEQEYEELLQYGNTTGAIFALKNMGWKDKVESEHSGEIKITRKIITSKDGK